MLQVVYHQPPAAATPSPLATLAKLGVAAGLMSTGVGAPFAAWLIADALKKPSVPTPEPPAPVVTPAEDSESDYELRLWRE